MSQAEAKLRTIGQQKINMSLDNTSRPDRQGRDELVPSRYALRVGEIDVLVVSDGVIQISAETMAPNADPAVRSAWLHDRFLPELVDWSLNLKQSHSTRTKRKAIANIQQSCSDSLAIENPMMEFPGPTP